MACAGTPPRPAGGGTVFPGRTQGEGPVPALGSSRLSCLKQRLRLSSARLLPLFLGCPLMKLRFGPCLLAAVWLIVLPGRPARSEPQGPAEIERIIQQLGSPRYPEREAA